MQGNNADNNMSKKDKELREQLTSLTREAIASGFPVQTLPPVEPDSGDASEQNDGLELQGKSIPLADVASHNGKGIVTLDLNALKGHKVNDSTEIPSYGDVTISASLNRLKTQPKVDETLKDTFVQDLSAQVLKAYADKDFAKAKELTARINAVQNGERNVKPTSGVDTTVINLGLGSIEGNRFVFARSAKGTVIWLDGAAHRLRFTVSRGLLEKEYPQPTDRQKANKAKKDKAVMNKAITRDADIAAQRIAWQIEQEESK